MKRAGSCLLAFALGASSMACTVKTIDAPVTLTTKPLPELSRPDVVQGAREVTGRSCAKVALLIIPFGVASVEDAVADALEQAPGTDTLLRYEERSDILMAFPFYTQACTIVHGYAVSSKSLAPH